MARLNKLLIAGICLLSWAGHAVGQPAVANVYQPFTDEPAYSTLTITSVAPSGSDRAIVVCVAENGTSGKNVSTVAFNTSESFTKIAEAGQDNATAGLWYLPNPTETTANVVITMNIPETAGAIMATGITLTGAQQTTPTPSNPDLTDTASCTSACSSIAANITTAINNSLLITCSRSQNGGVTWTHGSGQQEQSDFNVGGISESTSTSTEVKTTAGAEELTSTPTVAARLDYAAIAIAPANASPIGRRRLPSSGFK
jgi:hypothetical protein